jgi:tagaturonate epimerase
MKLTKYSFGIGDRFSLQGEAQLKAIMKAFEQGIEIAPVWNKSNREHMTIHSLPAMTRKEADAAVKALGWTKPYFVDADHINMENVDKFIDYSDFFTLDVADYIGKSASDEEIAMFINDNSKYLGEFKIPGVEEIFYINKEKLFGIANRFLYAVKQAGMIYRHIEGRKGKDSFVAEVSMDEVSEAQSPIELFFILSAIAAMGIPVQTIAPKFTGRFNKGVDYVGDVKQFKKEFEQDLLVINFATKEFGLPNNLKLSVHSGSDKFSIYPSIGNLIMKHDKGIHIKTAGTTWLEEAIGLSMAEGEALQLVKDIYKGGLNRFDELCGPYSTVIDIDKSKLPSAEDVQDWNGTKLANTLRHIPDHPLYNLHFRQLMHVSYKLAAEQGKRYTNLLKEHKELVGNQVTENIFDRHIKRLFFLNTLDLE